jgi:DNA-binding response OmpR family regulator
VRRTVLIVDDDAPFRRAARELLTLEGYEVVGEAADGESSVAAAARLGPAIVLLDVQLPDIDGFDVCQQITAYAKHPIVIMTSSRDSSDFGPLVTTSGACGFVPKAELSGERVQELLSP